MAELLSQKKFERLQKAIEWSEQCLEFHRRKRIEAITLFVGSHYAEHGAQVKIPVNNLKMAVDIYVRSLAPHAPRALATTIRDDVRATAVNFELAINEVPDEIGLDATLRKWVTEALFSFGILKCGLHSIGEAMGHEYGKTFVDVITLDDYFIDMAAKSMDQIQYEGNSYWMKIEDLQEKNWTHKENFQKVKADEYTIINEQGGERAESVTVNETAETYADQKWLRDVYLHDEGLLITYSVKDKKLYNVVEWDGPKNGPYYKLGFADVPGGLLPLAPVSVWRDLHELGNALFRKLGNQADSEKSVLGFSGGDEDEVSAFKNSSDGGGIMYTGAEPKTLTAGGVNQKTLAFYLQTRDLFSYFAGNLDSLGGLAIQSETATQDKLLSAAASAQLKDMSVRTVDSLTELFHALAYYEWNDPIKSRTLQKQIPNTEIVIPVQWNGESRRGNFSDYTINIDIYSLQDDSPSTKLQKVSLIMREYVAPYLQLIQQAGGTIDIQRLLQIVARYSDTPEINEIVIFMDQPMPPSPPGQSPMSAGSAGPAERVGKPGMTREGASNAIQQALLSRAESEQSGQ